MQIQVQVGDITKCEADIIVSTANPQLNMSGGVNGAILEMGGEAIQQELRNYLGERGVRHVPPTTVVKTQPGPLKASWILHAVAIDGFYDSSIETVAETIGNVFRMARELDAKTIAMPALATGYGPLSMTDFADAFRTALPQRGQESTCHVTVVLRSEHAAQEFREVINKGSGI